MLFSLFLATLVVAVNLLIPIYIAVFVYKDAKMRGMEPILWALVAALIPSFIGLIIYLIVRSGHSAWHCARCGAPVEEQYAVCPHCGAALKSRCPSCGRYVQSDWHICAYCSADLPGDKATAVVEQSAGNKGLWILLIVIAVVFVLFFLLLLVGNLAWIPHGGVNEVHQMWTQHL